MIDMPHLTINQYLTGTGYNFKYRAFIKFSKFTILNSKAHETIIECLYEIMYIYTHSCQYIQPEPMEVISSPEMRKRIKTTALNLENKFYICECPFCNYLNQISMSYYDDIKSDNCIHFRTLLNTENPSENVKMIFESELEDEIQHNTTERKNE